MTLQSIFSMIDDCCLLFLSLLTLFLYFIAHQKNISVVDAFDRDALLIIFAQTLSGVYFDEWQMLTSDLNFFFFKTNG
jgi:hypothetical protein